MLQEDGVKSLRMLVLHGGLIAVIAAFAGCLSQAAAQDATVPSAAAPVDAGSVHSLQDQVRELRTLVEEMRSENAQSRAEMQQLRQDLQATRALLERPADASAPPTLSESAPGAGSQSASTNAVTEGTQPNSIEDRVQRLEDTTSLIGSRIDEQYQTKVETASKYRARLHGIVLMNAFRNVGNSDNLDLPTYAEPVIPGWPQANLGATLRQSQIGLEIFGPTVAGAKTSADIQFDFSGGFPATGNGVNFGIVRLQTASLHFDWEHTSIIAGQDSLFISPLTPTSFASLALPSFGYSGNLCAWTPQFRVEHKFDIADDQNVIIQAGILDNVTGEPGYGTHREPQAGESSGQPAYAVRAGWNSMRD